MTYPKWFDYEVAEFSIVYYDDINSELVKRGVDAKEVISIAFFPDNSYTYHYRVFYRKPVKHLSHKPPFDEFEKAWWEKHPLLAHSEMGSNGQFDELPYAEYEKLYGKDAFDKTKKT